MCKWVDLQSQNGVLKNVGFEYFDTREGYEQIRDRIAFYGRNTAAITATLEADNH